MSNSQKSRVGRPSLPEDEARRARIEWATTAAIREQARAQAQALGMPLCRYLDQLIARHAPPPAEMSPAELRAWLDAP